MTGFAKLAFAVADETALGPRVKHVFPARANKQMIRVDAQGIVATVTRFKAARDFYALQAKCKVTDLTATAFPSPNRIPVRNATGPKPAT